MYLNRATIIGNVSRMGELRELPGAGKVKTIDFGVATNRIYTATNGEKKEESDFHNIVVFGKEAESVAEYVSVGTKILVEGRLQTRSWGEPKKHKTEIVADKLQWLKSLPTPNTE